MTNAIEICALCGRPATDDDPFTSEHVPAQQFYPKSMRNGLNLWTKIPTHRSCNQQFKLDEEYFYHAMYLQVANANPAMAKVILEDLERRAKKPQTRKLLRSILRDNKSSTSGGIVLPPGVVSIGVHEARIQQVAIKIARCLYFRDHNRFIPYENCKDIRICETEGCVPEMYQLSWELSKVNVNDLPPAERGGNVVLAERKQGRPKAVCEKVFSYRSAAVDGEYLCSLMFWESFLICMTFVDPQVPSTDDEGS